MCLWETCGQVFVQRLVASHTLDFWEFPCSSRLFQKAINTPFYKKKSLKDEIERYPCPHYTSEYVVEKMLF